MPLFQATVAVPPVPATAAYPAAVVAADGFVARFVRVVTVTKPSKGLIRFVGTVE
jgi:hypothetical protein